jgi:hypothetical protein
MEVAAFACHGDGRRAEEIVGGGWKCCRASHDTDLEEVEGVQQLTLNVTTSHIDVLLTASSLNINFLPNGNEDRINAVDSTRSPVLK